MFNLQDGTFTIVEESGEATPLGRYMASGEGTVDLLTGHLEAGGSYTAANGDLVFWTLTQDGPFGILGFEHSCLFRISDFSPLSLPPRKTRTAIPAAHPEICAYSGRKSVDIPSPDDSL